jgi:hypothetical protein
MVSSIVGKADRRRISYPLYYFFSSEQVQKRNGEANDHFVLAGRFAGIGGMDHGDERIK